MPLNKTKVDVVFDRGLNNKIDSKLTLGADLLTLNNRVFTKAGALSKRKGFSNLSNTDCFDTTISNMDALSIYDNTEMLLFADSKLYSYSSPLDRWIQKDTVQSASVELKAVVNDSNYQFAFDFCRSSGVALFVWTDYATDYLLYSVQDITSGTFYVQNAVLSTTGTTPRCLALGNSLFVLYGDSADLKFLSVSAASPCASPVVGTLSTTYEDLHADHIFDAVAVGNTGFIFYKGGTASTIQELEINTAGTVLTDNTITADVVTCLTVGSYTASDAKDYIHLAYKEDANTVKAGIYTRSLIVHQAIQTIDNTTGTDISKITLAKRDQTDSVRIFYQTDDANPAITLIRSNTLDLDGTLGTAAVFMRSVGIASRAFNNGTDLLINVLHESELQSTVFMVNESAEVVTVLSQGNAGTHDAIWVPANVQILTTGEYAFPMNVKGRIRSENATLFSLLGLSLARLDFQGPNVYNSTNLNSNLFAAGGLLNVYDGQHMTEQGFHLFPEGLAQSSTATSGGFMSDGVYQYSAIYRWTDNRGNVHQSAPSIPITVTVSGGGSTQTVDIDVPTLRVTKKLYDRGDATIELFRTESNGTIFYKVTTLLAPVLNDITVDSITIEDGVADSSIISNEILYTTGDVLDNIAAPACGLVTSHKNRLFISGLQNKNEIRYSKIARVGEGTAFNEALSIYVDPKGGRITNLASMDSNLIVFKRDNIYRIAGDGPSDTGAGGSFTEPELISTDVGCTDSNSVVLGPTGLFFKSAKGIYILDRSLTATYIGAPVEDFNSETITSTRLLDDVNEIRFATSGGNILVYNYFFEQWSVFTGHFIIDATNYNNKYTAVTSSDVVLQETSGFKDSEAFVNSKIATGWIRIGEMQGYQRAYRVSVLGQFKSKHQLKVSIYNDYSSVLVQEQVFDVNSIMSVDEGFYGDGIYGDGIYGYEDNGVYQFQLHLKKQKCQAFRVVIEDIYDNSDNDGSGEGAEITGITVEIGSMRGLNKLRTGKTA